MPHNVLPDDWQLFIPETGDGPNELHEGELVYGTASNKLMLKSFYSKWFNDPNYRHDLLDGKTKSGYTVSIWCLIKLPAPKPKK